MIKKRTAAKAITRWKALMTESQQIWFVDCSKQSSPLLLPRRMHDYRPSQAHYSTKRITIWRVFPQHQEHIKRAKKRRKKVCCEWARGSSFRPRYFSVGKNSWFSCLIERHRDTSKICCSWNFIVQKSCYLCFQFAFISFLCQAR